LLNNGLLTALVRADAYDFTAMYLAGHGILERAELYSDEALARLRHHAPPAPGIRFLYPPISAVLFVPLACLPFWLAARVWVLVNLACLAAAVRLLAPYLLGSLDAEKRLLWAGFGALLLAGYHSLGHTLQVGQATLVMAVLLLGGLALARANRDLAAAALLAIGTFFKPVAMLLAFYLLLKGRWRFIAFWIAAMLVGAAASIAFFGTDVHVTWLRYFAAHHGAPMYSVSYQDAVSFWGRLFKWEGICPFPQYGYLAGPLTTATQVILLLPMLPLLLMRRWGQLTDRRLLAEFSLLLLVTILAANLAGIHIYLLLTFGLAAALAYLRQDSLTSRQFWNLAVAWAAAYCLLALPFQYRAPELQHGILVLAISTKFYGGLVLWVILRYLLACDHAAVTEPRAEGPGASSGPPQARGASGDRGYTLPRN